MTIKKVYLVPKAERFIFFADVILTSYADNLTQDKEWTEWVEGEQ